MTIFDSTTDKCENCGHPQKAHDYEAHALGACCTPSRQMHVDVQAGRDIRILLAQIAFLEDLTGEKLEDEDAALVAQIKASYPASDTEDRS